MVTYECCANVSIENIYEAFKIGFSDYIIKNQISIEAFKKRFFEPDESELQKSFIAMDGDKPIGLILSGVKTFDGKDNVKSGILSISPRYRNSGVSDELFYLHKNVAIKNSFQQIFLEIVYQTDRAIRFHTKLGYKKKQEMLYYTNKDIGFLKNKEISHEISQITFTDFKSLKKKLENIHMNWQNDFEYMEKLKNNVQYFGIYKKSDIKAALAIGKSGKIYSIWVDKSHRNKNMATDLLAKAIDELKIKSLYVNFSSNIEIESFLKSLNFKKDDLCQYEKYLVL